MQDGLSPWAPDSCLASLLPRKAAWVPCSSAREPWAGGGVAGRRSSLCCLALSEAEAAEVNIRACLD